MNARKLAIITAVVVALAIAAVIGNDFGTQRATTSALVLPQLADTLDDIDAVAIHTAGGEAAVELVRRDGEWHVEQRSGHAADFSLIRAALVDLAEARIVEEKTANPDLYNRLGVEDVEQPGAGGILVSLSAAGTALPGLIIGEPEGSQYRYVRIDGEAQSVMIDRNPELPADPADWLDSLILDVRGSRMAEIVIEHADRDPLRIFKDDSSQTNFSVEGIPEGRSLQYPGVANVIGNSLRELQLEDVAPLDGEPVNVQSTTTFRTFDGLILTARGFTIEEDNWLVFSAGVVADEAQVTETGSEDDAGESVTTEAVTTEVVTREAVTEEAADINARVSGWRYRIPAYQYSQLTRRMDDLLSAETAEDDE